MGKIATRIDRMWLRERERATERALSLGEQVLAARVAIVAAKLAYRTESDRWLSLLSKAVSAVEACPEPIRSELNRELLCLSVCDVVAR